MNENHYFSLPSALKKLYKEEFFDIRHYDAHRRKNFSYSFNHPLYFPHVSEQLFNNGFIPHYPNNKDFAICLTHDIDSVTRKASVLGVAKNVAYGRIGKAINDISVHIMSKRSELNNVHKMLEHEARYNAKSTYFFLSLKKGEKDFNYNPSDIKHIFRQVEECGSEIGLHGGHEASTSAKKIISEKRLLEDASSQLITGYRGHYLKFKYPDTWKYLEDASIKYDTTYSYPEIIGFRNGMCYPFLPDNVTSLLEYPLIVSDHILFNYMKIDANSSFELIELLMQRVKKVKGVMVILWHNSYYTGELIELYDNILKLGNENNAWFASMNSLNNWWQTNNYINDYSKYCPEIFG